MAIRALAAVVATILLAAPAGAQTLSAADSVMESWSFQGGPFGGMTVGSRGFVPEGGLRLGLQRETQVLDLSVSAYRIRYELFHDVRTWSVEALAGRTWQPGPVGLGFRAGALLTANALEERLINGAIGLHLAWVAPVNSRFGFRSELGGQIALARGQVPMPYRGYVRVGLERLW